MKAAHKEALFWVAFIVAIVAFSYWRGSQARELERAGGLTG